MNYDSLYQKFVGLDKVQPLNVLPGENDSWVLRYKEGKVIREITCKNREDLEKILIEFGGKNPETCKTFSQFLDFDGSWTSETLNELGHRITKIAVLGYRILRQQTIPIQLPEKSGYSGTVQSMKRGPDVINYKLKDREDATITRSFNNSNEFETFMEFILKDEPMLKDLRWTVRTLGTESRETQNQCVWSRVNAGDGTNRMVLELHALDGAWYEDCVRQELFNAAGDMFDAPCKRIKLKKKKEHFRNICLFAAEDGDVDINSYELA